MLQGTEELTRFIYVKLFKSLKSMYVYKQIIIVVSHASHVTGEVLVVLNAS